MDGQPLLYIASPKFIKQVIEQEESTSIFVPTAVEKPTNALVKKQLSYFSKPLKEPRMLLFLMNDGERIYASIDRLQANEVLLNCFHNKRWIKASDIVMIQHTM